MRHPGDARRRPAGRPRFTSRAAVLAIVVCAIALSLAYPVREFITQRRQIGQLEAQHQQIEAQLSRLTARQRQLADPAYIERQARNKLHMCVPGQTCYVIISRKRPASQAAQASAVGTPWYQRVWTSVQQADKEPAR